MTRDYTKPTLAEEFTDECFNWDEPDLEHPWYEDTIEDIKPGLDDIDDELGGLNSTGII